MNGSATEVPKTDFESFIYPVFQAFYENREQLLLLNKAGLSGQLLDVLKEYFSFDEIPDAAGTADAAGGISDAQDGPNIRKFQMAFRIGGIYSCRDDKDRGIRIRAEAAILFCRCYAPSEGGPGCFS